MDIKRNGSRPTVRNRSQAGLSSMSWLLRLGLGRGRAHLAELEQQVNALQDALARCKGVARPAGAQGARMAIGAVLILALGFVLGANSEAIKQSVADWVPGFASPGADADAAYAAYDKGDHAAALRLARALAEQGDVRAQSLVGLIYYSGRGGLRNEAEAVKWFRVAADQGDAAAQFRLGLMYSEGQGVPQDHAEAARWYEFAANERYAPAQYNLGLLYAAGEGVAQDHVQAHLWLNLAVTHFPASDTRNRNAAIQSRDVAAGKLAHEQLAEAQRLAREWQPVRHVEYGAARSMKLHRRHS